MGLDQKELDKILDWFNKSNLTSAKIECNVSGDYKITLSREQTVAPMMPMATMATPAQAAPAQSVAPSTAGSTEENASANTDTVQVVAPIVGTFYRSPGPDSPPFVQVGDIIKKGETLCILEAMKVMNELEAEFDMEIMSVLLDSGDLAEFGQTLYEVKAL